MRTTSTVLAIVAASLLGMLAIVVPTVLTPGIQRYDAPLLPLALVRTAVEGMRLPALVALVLVGGGLGVFTASPPWLLGVATMVLFPLVAIADMILDPASHNLFPIEFAMYGLLTVPPIVGAYGGRRVRLWWSRGGTRARSRNTR